MSLLIDKFILLVCCSAVYLTGESFTNHVVPILLAIIFTSLLSYFEQERMRMLLVGLFLILGMFLPWLCIFLPLICYELFFSKKQSVSLLGLLPLSLFWPSAEVQVKVSICTLLLLSACLKYRTLTFEHLKRKYYQLRDTTKEMALQLKQQNQNLLMQQDAEIKMATLGERNRIAREIHDNVGHLLSRALLQIGALVTVNHRGQTRDALAALKDTLSEAMGSIRSSVHDLHDDSIDLHAQLTDLVRKFTFCPVSFDYSIEHAPRGKLTYALISIVKEALSNIARHSDATLAKVVLREHPAFYQLVIADNGHVRNPDLDHGIGIKNMKERTEAFHGHINIEIKNGFELFITVPKEGYK
ncbi:histidine kinase [Sporolactobacillus sp. CPB3-1]|uniref:histidine kinase n=1 Tax=Sporolactobacillus mangiferae TaxID=2940498 RepID=A0ABT0M861_9BACL|nr:histidine kinase [Sporolactobacillus mangiferae]MCL1631067.1 histidine kinase [Sporolactobacillus mangiferae]